jgi:outer membrane protein
MTGVRRVLRNSPALLRLLAALAFALGTGLAGVAAAQTDGYKIGVIHVERIMQESAAAKTAHDRIEKAFEGRNADITRMEQDQRTAAMQLEKDSATLSPDERAARERAVELRGREVQRLRQQFGEDLHARQFEELDKLKARLDQVLTRYAKANDFDLILQDALWVGLSVDITDDVIKALDAN